MESSFLSEGCNTSILRTGLSSATTILSTGYRPLGSCSRAAGWSAATLCYVPKREVLRGSEKVCLSGVDRKWLTPGQNDAIDPKQTCASLFQEARIENFRSNLSSSPVRTS